MAKLLETSGFHVSAGDCCCNCCMTVLPDGSVDRILAASRPMWHPGDFEPEDHHARSKRDESKNGDTKRARRRAKNRVATLIKCNRDLDTFLTLTIKTDAKTEHGLEIGRTDFTAINRKLQQWLADRVRRHGLKYVAVYEYHKAVEEDGKHAIHVHLVCNHDALKMVDSGHQYKDPMGHWHHIYNVPDWKLGITTAMYMYGNRGRAISYICKYINKSEEAVGGRWYMHSSNLQEPRYIYCNVDFDSAPGRFYRIDEARVGIKEIPVTADLAQLLEMPGVPVPLELTKKTMWEKHGKDYEAHAAYRTATNLRLLKSLKYR